MEKLKLKDGTELFLHNASTENAIVIILNEKSATDVISTLTESNLSQFSILDADGNESAFYKDKEMVLPAPISKVEDDYILTVYLKDVDMVQKRIRLIEEENIKLRESVEFLLINTLETETESEG